MCDYRLLILVIVSVSILPIAGCMGVENGYEDYEYSVSTSEPYTGDVFGDVGETQFYSEWGYTYASVQVMNGVNESMVDSSGNWSIPDGNATTVQLEQVRVTNGSTEVMGSREITPDDPDWGAHLDVPSDGDEERYLLRATADNRTIDYVEMTVRET